MTKSTEATPDQLQHFKHFRTAQGDFSYRFEDESPAYEIFYQGKYYCRQEELSIANGRPWKEYASQALICMALCLNPEIRPNFDVVKEEGEILELRPKGWPEKAVVRLRAEPTGRLKSVETLLSPSLKLTDIEYAVIESAMVPSAWTLRFPSREFTDSTGKAQTISLAFRFSLKDIALNQALPSDAFEAAAMSSEPAQ